MLQIARGMMTAVGMTASAAAGAQVWHCGHSGAALKPANASGFTVEAEHLEQDMFDPVDMQLAVEQSIEEQVGWAGGAGPSGSTPPEAETPHTRPRPDQGRGGKRRAL